jgi:hypothetical protein
MSQQDLAKSLKSNKAYKKANLYKRDHFLYMDDAIINAYAKGDEAKAAIYSAIKRKGTSKLRGVDNPSKGYLLRFGSYNSAARWLHKILKDVDLGHVGTTGAMGAMSGKLGSSRARGKMPVVKALGSAVSKQNTRVLEVISEAIPGVNVEFIKEVSDKAIKGKYKYQIVMPQSVDLNRKQIKEIETIYNNEVKRIANTILTQKGSKSILQLTDDVIDAAIKGGKIPKSKTESTAFIKPKVTKKTIPLPRLRDKKGQFTSAASIKQIIQAQITEQVKDNMGEGGSLVNRTGRFAESVTITNVTQSRQGSLTAFYNYMKYPYQTFERGFKQGSTRRDPRLLIHKSIREIAQKLVHRKLNIKTRRV